MSWRGHAAVRALASASGSTVVRAMRTAALGWALALGVGLAGAQAGSEPLAVPTLSGRLVDRIGLLPGPQAAALEQRLARLEAERGSQVVVLIVGSTQPEDIASFAQRVGEAWKIGRRDVGDGVLIVVASADRRINIQVSKALEGAVPDLAARQIIDRDIGPAFRAGDFATGLLRAVDSLDARIRGEGLASPPATGERGGGSGGMGEIEGLVSFLFVAVPLVGAALVGVFGRRLGSLLTGAAAGGIGWWLTASLLVGTLAALGSALLIGVFGTGLARGVRLGSGRGGRMGGPAGWGGGGGGWSGAGGGFRSGGGGDFGGGGASGSW